RILYPMRRVGRRGEGRCKRISWEETLSEVALKLMEIRERPEEFVLHCGLDRTQGFVRRFAHAFGTPSFVQNYSLGKVNKFVAQELTWGHSMEVPDLTRTKYILNFGCNVYEASMFYIPMVQRVVQARVDNVAKMVTFDVRLANAAGRSDEWILVKPGTDGIIALAMAYVILEEGLYDRDF
ncbi:MAG: molybdopterin-dependent oxidoreductase, partial [Armatimonadetes bacterium]|nr:molybdopterin-dependent oxidoreductase [Armatimonadota bacterium]